jgi:homopolymeric O-antigen transport system permease protein
VGILGCVSLREAPQHDVPATPDEVSALDHPHAAVAPGASVRIEAPRRWQRPALRELWRYRELLYFLAWRDIKVRYKQTALGVTWSIAQPLLVMVVFSLVFGHLAQLPSEGLPYPLFAFAALVPWTFFSNALTSAAGSLVATPELITKVFFPRLIMPSASILGGLPDLAFSLVTLLAIGAYYGFTPTPRALLVFPLILLLLACAVGVGSLLAALNVEYRDVKYALTFVVQLWLFASPVAYSSTMVPEQWRLVYALNPMVGVIEGFRWSLFGADTSPGSMIAVSSGAGVLLFLAGVFYFRRVEDRFADVI